MGRFAWKINDSTSKLVYSLVSIIIKVMIQLQMLYSIWLDQLLDDKYVRIPRYVFTIYILGYNGAIKVLTQEEIREEGG